MVGLRWSCATRTHDWRDLGVARRVFSHVGELGLLHDVQWLEMGDEPRREHRTTPEALCDLAAEQVRARGSAVLAAGSARGVGWQVSIFIPEHDRRGAPVSYSLVILRFDGDVASTDLVAAFRACHSPADTEYASIHPYEAWADLREGPYAVPVTVAPMFDGVLWANFLGPGHIDQFDLGQVLPLGTAIEEHDRGDELRFVITSEVTDVQDPPVVQRLLELTERFRLAHRPRE